MGEVEVDRGPALVAYAMDGAAAMPLVRAGRARAWMERTNEHFANRCLPLLMANQAGWFLLSAHSLRLTWTGGDDAGGVRVELLGGPGPAPALSHFGHGIVTFRVPYLFRTAPGYNLLVRGPANWPKDGIAPLEGLVETDWSAATFTVNWQLTRPDHPVTFEAGEPICLLVPQRRSELESFRPELRRLEAAPDLQERHDRWSRGRADFNVELGVPGSGAVRQRWEKHYFRGLTAGGAAAPEHQTKLSLREFADRRDAHAVEDDLVVRDDFLDAATCEALVQGHARFGQLEARSDNGYPLSQARRHDARLFATARLIVRELTAFIARCYGKNVGCDLALLCAIRPGFQHTLHADNALVWCPKHGDDQAQLRQLDCQCPDIVVRPNHTPWRRYSALLYLSDGQRGGDIVFGEGPNIYGRQYRRHIRVRPGLLVLSPSTEHHYHYTTPVESGVRYSMNCWFTDDDAHVAPEWS